MSSLLKGLFLIAFISIYLLATSNSQSNNSTACNVACGACNTTGPDIYFKCWNCSQGFTSNGTSSDGVVNCTQQAKYTDVYYTQDISASVTSLVSTCGPFINDKYFGMWGKDTNIVVWNYTNQPLPNHFKLRIIFSVLFILNWSGDNNISLYFNTTLKKYLQYGSLPNLGTSFCSSPPANRYGRIDTGDLDHSDIDIDISIASSTCNSCATSPCLPCNWIVPDIYILIQKCHDYCQLCLDATKTNCTACANFSSIQYKLSGKTCEADCLIGYYQIAPNQCDRCQDNCTYCVGSKLNCTACYPGYFLFPPNPANVSCLSSCPTTPIPYYYDSILGYCNACDTKCKLCTGNPSPCSACNANYYYLQDQCLSVCPIPLIQDKLNWICQDCQVYCVRLTVTQYIPPGGSGLTPLYFDLNFTQAIDWTTFNYSAFTSLIFGGSMFSTSSFNVTYYNTSSKSYRISIAPFNYAFIINQSVILTVRSKPDPAQFNYSSIDTRPFHNTVFNQSVSAKWTYLKPPNMTDTQYSIVSTLSTFSTTVNTAFSGPGAQQFKKFGFILLILNSVQITSCLMLLNTVLPQNLYEGIRFFASLVFFDVPDWQSESSSTKFVFMVPIKNIQGRRLLQTVVDQFYFRRTGFSGIFLFDTYSQILMIILCYLVLGVCILLSKYWKKMKKARPYFSSTIDAFHEIAIMYFTLSIVFQVVYFDGSSLKWASIVICFLVNLYYLGYQIRVYYVLLQYPKTAVTDPKFEDYVARYSYYLKYLRFDDEEYHVGKCSIIKYIFRPHNYHILSYMKKFLMMLTFPLFYDYSFAQISILIILQIFQLIRVLVSRPYVKRWRNVVRVILESILLVIFLIILLIEVIMVVVTNQGASTSTTWADLYFTMGWIGFTLIFTFNFGFLSLFIFNTYRNFTRSNRQILEQSRRVYYFQLLNDHQQQHKKVPMNLINQWVKKGNLNKRDRNSLPTSDYRIQYYSIEKKQKFYLVDLNVIFSISMDTEYNFKQDDNNIVPNDQLQSYAIILVPQSPIYKLFDYIFRTYGSIDTLQINVKTFITVKQKDFGFGDQIPFDPKKIYHQIEVIHSGNQQYPPQKIPLIEGFPIPKNFLITYSQYNK